MHAVAISEFHTGEALASHTLHAVRIVHDVSVSSTSKEVGKMIAHPENINVLNDGINEWLSSDTPTNTPSLDKADLTRKLEAQKCPRRVGGTSATVVFTLHKFQTGFLLRVDCFGHFIDIPLNVLYPKVEKKNDNQTRDAELSSKILNSVSVVNDYRDPSTSTEVRRVIGSHDELIKLVTRLQTAISAETGGVYMLSDISSLKHNIQLAAFPHRHPGQCATAYHHLQKKDNVYSLRLDCWGTNFTFNLKLIKDEREPTAEEKNMIKEAMNTATSCVVIDRKDAASIMDSMFAPRNWANFMEALNCVCIGWRPHDVKIDEEDLHKKIRTAFEKHVPSGLDQCAILITLDKTAVGVPASLSIYSNKHFFVDNIPVPYVREGVKQTPALPSMPG